MAEGIPASPCDLSESALAGVARSVLDRSCAARTEAATALCPSRVGSQRAFADLQAVARAAAFGAVDLLVVDIDEGMPGRVDETDGPGALATQPGAASYGVIDESPDRAILAGAKVLAVLRADMPEGAAILRHPV